MKESLKVKFRHFVDTYSLTADDFFTAKQGFVIVTRTGIEKIQRGLGATVAYEVVPEFSSVADEKYTIKATAMVSYIVPNEKTGKAERVEKFVESFGESSPKNCHNAYRVAMAEKRALSRVILKLADIYELGVYGEDEIENVQKA
jgi:hypothetical protein